MDLHKGVPIYTTTSKKQKQKYQKITQEKNEWNFPFQTTKPLEREREREEEEIALTVRSTELSDSINKPLMELRRPPEPGLRIRGPQHLAVHRYRMNRRVHFAHKIITCTQPLNLVTKNNPKYLKEEATEEKGQNGFYPFS